MICQVTFGFLISMMSSCLLYALSLLILGTHVFGTGLFELLSWVKLISHSILVSQCISFWAGSYLYILTTVQVSLLGRESSVPHHLLTNPHNSVIFVLIYFLVLVLVLPLIFQFYFRFSFAVFFRFSFSFANNQIIPNLLTKTC